MNMVQCLNHREIHIKLLLHGVTILTCFGNLFENTKLKPIQKRRQMTIYPVMEILLLYRKYKIYVSSYHKYRMLKAEHIFLVTKS
jgi:uncharacterized protein YhhL (DUF1145 family)